MRGLYSSITHDLYGRAEDLVESFLFIYLFIFWNSKHENVWKVTDEDTCVTFWINWDTEQDGASFFVLSSFSVAFAFGKAYLIRMLVFYFD